MKEKINKESVSFLLLAPLTEMVYWGKDKFDDDDFHPNPFLQIMANYLSVNFPICFLYRLYFDFPRKGGRDCHIFKSADTQHNSIMFLDLASYDETDQHDMVYLGIKCSKKYGERVHKLLTECLANMEVNPAVNPLITGSYIEQVEATLIHSKS